MFNKEPYQRAVSAMERAKWKLDKAAADLAKNSDKHAKRHQRALDDYSEACSEVARRHAGPGILTSVFFLILLRILGTEYVGRVVAILPFVPFRLMSRITARGLEWKDVDLAVLEEGSKVDTKQAASFLFIYLLATFSVKYFVSKAVGMPAPPGADRGIMSIVDTPNGHKVLKSFGVDPNELKLQ